MDNYTASVIEIPQKALESVVEDPVKSAQLVKLFYVTDETPGITRRKYGDDFRYFFNKKQIEDEDVLARIRKLAIPPAWQDVWICKSDNGHLQVTGRDAKNRKQYRYHTLWNKIRSETKYFRMYEFGKSLPSIRKQLEKDISLKGSPLEKILAAVVLLMERTSIRVGNSFYEKLYGSFGLTTLKNRHVTVNGNNIRFTFKGKKGVQHSISLRSKRLADIVKKCREIPGKELFEYYDQDGNIYPIDSGMVNDYIKRISGNEFSSKDFRTWAGTISFLSFCKERRDIKEEKEMNHVMVEILDQVAKHLGNTRTVCKKYYVHPLMVNLYESHKLDKYFDKVNAGRSLYSPEEKILMKILSEDSKITKVIQLS